MTVQGLPDQEKRVALRLKDAPASCCSCLNLGFKKSGEPFCDLPDKKPSSFGGGQLVGKCSGENRLIDWVDQHRHFSMERVSD